MSDRWRPTEYDRDCGCFDCRTWRDQSRTGALALGWLGANLAQVGLWMSSWVFVANLPARTYYGLAY